MFQLPPSLVICAYFVCAGWLFTAAYLLYISWHSSGKISLKVYMSWSNKTILTFRLDLMHCISLLIQGYSKILEVLFDYIFGRLDILLPLFFEALGKFRCIDMNGCMVKGCS